MRFALLLALAGCSASTVGLDPLVWQKVPGPGPGGALLGLGSPGAFDERGNFTVSAFRDGDLVRLYYGGADTSGSCAGINSAHWRIGLATSTDGVSFTRVPGDATGGALLDNGAPGRIRRLSQLPALRAQGRGGVPHVVQRQPQAVQLPAPARSPTTAASATPSRPTAST